MIPFVIVTNLDQTLESNMKMLTPTGPAVPLVITSTAQSIQI